MDLNLIKNYKKFTNGHCLNEQMAKVMEEYKEVIAEWSCGDNEKLISELLDLMTATMNAIYLIQSNEKTLDMLFQKHIEKLNSYIKYKYAIKEKE